MLYPADCTLEGKPEPNVGLGLGSGLGYFTSLTIAYTNMTNSHTTDHQRTKNPMSNHSVVMGRLALPYAIRSGFGE